ncbi:hypothetical protein ACFL47_07460 [Candidatus Latescibacterota bacterium]
MLKPPFTIIIVQKTREPLTIQVTYGLFASIFTLFMMLSLFFGLGISVLTTRVNIPYLSDTIAQTKQPVKTTQSDFSLKPLSMKNLMRSKPASSSVDNVSLDGRDLSDLTLRFSLGDGSSYETVYVWLMVNPESEIAGESVIYPRNPVYRGLPIDYRNGIAHHLDENSEISVDISGLIIGIDFRKLGIIAFSDSGEMLVNTRYEVAGSKRM